MLLGVVGCNWTMLDVTEYCWTLQELAGTCWMPFDVDWMSLHTGRCCAVLLCRLMSLNALAYLVCRWMQRDVAACCWMLLDPLNSKPTQDLLVFLTFEVWCVSFIGIGRIWLPLDVRE